MQQTPPMMVRVGALSPNTVQGATGRISAASSTANTTNTATAVSPSASVGGTPKPVVSAGVVVSPAATAAVNAATTSSVPAATAAMAPDGTALLSAPLGLQATVLSQPSFYPSLGEDLGDFTEEGDILFPVLGDPWSRVRSRERRADNRNPDAPDASTELPVVATVAARLRNGVDFNAQTEGDGDDDAVLDADGAAAATALSEADTNTTNTAVSTRGYRLSSSLPTSTALCVQPVLTLPRKVGVSLACEVFRALLCFHNAATYPLTQAHFHIGVAQPPAPLRRALLRRTVTTLPPKSNYTVIAAVPLGEASTYSLAVAVDYSDPSGRQRHLSWNSTLKTEQPIMEAAPRRLAYLRPCLPMQPAHPTAGSVNGTATAGTSATTTTPPPALTRRYAKYQLTIGLKNMSSVPLIMTAAELLLPTLAYHNGKPLFCDFTPAREGPASPGEGGPEAGVGERAAPSTQPPTASSFLMPGDTQTLVFVIGVYLEELRHATVVHGQGGVTTRLLSPRLTSFGQVQWTWRRANGETGTARSAPLRVEQLVAESDVSLRVAAVLPATTAPASGATGTANAPSQSQAVVSVVPVDDAPLPQALHAGLLSTSSCSALPPPPPQLLLAGSPLTLRLVLANHSSIHRYEVALKVRVERLAPQWLYTGPTVRRLGALEPSSTLTFTLSLLPWQAGVLQVAQSALEVVDAQMPEAVLWPPSSTSLLQPVDGPSSAAAEASKESDGRPTLVATLPAVAQAAMRATLPADGDVLCEVLVL